MGSVVSTAANDVGTFLGNAFAAPFRTLFGASCEGVCSGTWDVACFLEHLCISSLARLFMVLVLTYIMLFFVYLMCKVGIIQCIVKNTCKMAAAACSASWHTLGATSCFLWRKLRNTKRVHHGRRRDVEEGGGGFSSSSNHDEEGSSSFDDDHDRDRSERGSSRTSRTRGGSSVRERRKGKLRRSLRLRRLTSKEHATMRSHGSGRRHHHVGLRRIEVSSSSLHVHGEAMRRMRIHREG